MGRNFDYRPEEIGRISNSAKLVHQADLQDILGSAERPE
jgi:hypothetical protein